MVKIDWEYPEQGSGTARIVTELIGPGATRAEIGLVSLAGVLGGCALIVYQYVVGLGWSLLQVIIGSLVAFDIGGGFIANSTSTAKRWYHRKEQGFKHHFGFVVIHFIHPLLITLFFTTLDWVFFLTVYGYLLVSSIAVLGVPLYLKRPVSVLMVSGAILLNTYIVSPIPGFEWFIPIFMLKLVTGHILREEPYRPE